MVRIIIIITFQPAGTMGKIQEIILTLKFFASKIATIGNMASFA